MGSLQSGLSFLSSVGTWALSCWNIRDTSRQSQGALILSQLWWLLTFNHINSFSVVPSVMHLHIFSNANYIFDLKIKKEQNIISCNFPFPPPSPRLTLIILFLLLRLSSSLIFALGHLPQDITLLLCFCDGLFVHMNIRSTISVCRDYSG